MMDGWKDRWSFWTSFWLAFMNEVTFWLLDVMSPLNMRQEKKAQLQIMFSFLRSFCLMSMSYWYFLGVHLKCYVKCSDLKYIEVDEKENVICFINDQRSSSMPSQTILLGLTAETPVCCRMNKFFLHRTIGQVKKSPFLVPTNPTNLVHFLQEGYVGRNGFLRKKRTSHMSLCLRRKA